MNELAFLRDSLDCQGSIQRHSSCRLFCQGGSTLHLSIGHSQDCEAGCRGTTQQILYVFGNRPVANDGVVISGIYGIAAFFRRTR